MAKLPFGIHFQPIDRHLAEDVIYAAQYLLKDPKDKDAAASYKAALAAASKWALARPDEYPLAGKLLEGRPLSFRRKTIAGYLASQTINGLTAKLPGHAERRRARVMAKGADVHA